MLLMMMIIIIIQVLFAVARLRVVGRFYVGGGGVAGGRRGLSIRCTNKLKSDAAVQLQDPVIAVDREGSCGGWVVGTEENGVTGLGRAQLLTIIVYGVTGLGRAQLLTIIAYSFWRTLFFLP